MTSRNISPARLCPCLQVSHTRSHLSLTDTPTCPGAAQPHLPSVPLGGPQRSVIMFLAKLLILILVVVICCLHQAEARPRAHIVGNHIMKRHRSADRNISNNKTGKKWRQAKHMKHKNRNLIKSLLAFQDDYEYEEYDNAPIIEIRFKRETIAENAKTETESSKKNILIKNFLNRRNRS